MDIHMDIRKNARLSSILRDTTTSGNLFPAPASK